jgi:hypothetical protein
MSAIDADKAKASLRPAAPNGVVNASGTTRSGRPTWFTYTLDEADLQIDEASQLEWVEGDEDGYHLWVLTTGGRWYRMDAVDPDGPPRPIG